MVKGNREETEGRKIKSEDSVNPKSNLNVDWIFEDKTTWPLTMLAVYISANQGYTECQRFCVWSEQVTWFDE